MCTEGRSGGGKRGVVGDEDGGEKDGGVRGGCAALVVVPDGSLLWNG